ncbi:hypothetical protein RI129_012795 [Pyrocoelia pectoralis]|uniref:Regulatory protein zeste n=1 Tax=Pyrocoelia pectoralis TaxID=417401 RepID=A0AAN7UUC0_9COLE
MSASQKSALIKSIQLNSQLISGKFTNTFTHKKAQQLWMQISETLNAIPGDKNNGERPLCHYGRTGGGRPNDEILTEDDDKILSLVSPVEIV